VWEKQSQELFSLQVRFKFFRVKDKSGWGTGLSQVGSFAPFPLFFQAEMHLRNDFQRFKRILD